MGVYINPINSQSPEDWLLGHGGIRLSNGTDVVYENWRTLRDRDLIPVCLLDNGSFKVASVAFLKEDVRTVQDGRPKSWFVVPLRAFEHGSGISRELLRLQMILQE